MDPGAEEDVYRWDWEDSDAAWQPAQNATEVDGMDDAGLDATIRAWDTLELEIPEEMAQAGFLSPDLTFDSNTPPSSTFTRGNTSSVQKGNAPDGGDYEPMENNAMAAPSRNEASSANEWLCEETNCGRAFARQCELKYVQVTLTITTFG